VSQNLRGDTTVLLPIAQRSFFPIRQRDRCADAVTSVRSASNSNTLILKAGPARKIFSKFVRLSKIYYSLFVKSRRAANFDGQIWHGIGHVGVGSCDVELIGTELLATRHCVEVTLYKVTRLVRGIANK
jgi:hypothetical protein